MTIKKKIVMYFSFVVCMITVLTVETNAYDITEVSYIWEYLEKDDFITAGLRSLGWFANQTIGMLLNLCYDTFTSIATWDILSLPIVGNIIVNLDTLLPYILVITIIVVTVIRVMDFQNMMKIFANILIVGALLATFSHVLVLVDGLKNAGLSEAANVVGVSDYKMTDVLLAENTVDVKKSLDSGSVQFLDKADVEHFQHDLRLDKSDLNEEIVRQNPDGSYETVSLSDGLFGIGQVHFFRYKTDYWSLNVTMLVSVIVYIMASFKMGYLLAQWLQENLFGVLLMVKGIWDYRSVGKIFKSILSTVFAQIEVYFMMLFFSFFCSNVISSETLDNWMAKAIVIYAMGMMIISGSGFINDALGIDDGSNFILRSMIVGKRTSQAVRAPMRAIGGVAGTVGGVGSAILDPINRRLLSSFHTANTGQKVDQSDQNTDLNITPPMPPAIMGNKPDDQYKADGTTAQNQKPTGRNTPSNMMSRPYGINGDTNNNVNMGNNGTPNDGGIDETSQKNTPPYNTNHDMKNVFNTSDCANDLKEKYSESLNQENKRTVDNVNANQPKNHQSMIKTNTSGTVSHNPDHVKKMEMISKGYTGTSNDKSNCNNQYISTKNEMDDLINSLNEWDKQR